VAVIVFDDTETPPAFLATTLIEYVVPLVRPVMAQLVVVEVQLALDPPALALIT
jgi:hypothetical protein